MKRLDDTIVIYDYAGKIQSPCKREISIQFSFSGVYIISYSFCQPFNKILAFARMTWKERATDIHPNKLACKHLILYDCHSQNGFLIDISNTFSSLIY